MTHDYNQISVDGVWSKNLVLAQGLALCPLLAVTTTATNGLGMGMATSVVLLLSGLTVALFRRIISAEVRIPVFVLIIATIVTLVDMSMNAWMHDLHAVLGLFIPLIVTNCAILGRAESFASKHAVLPALIDGLMMGLGFTLVLVLLGACREVVGSGTLFANAKLLLGDRFGFMEVTVVSNYRGFLVAILPAGGFLVLGFLLAGKRFVERRLVAARAKIKTSSEVAEAI